MKKNNVLLLLAIELPVVAQEKKESHGVFGASKQIVECQKRSLKVFDTFGYESVTKIDLKGEASKNTNKRIK